MKAGMKLRMDAVRRKIRQALREAIQGNDVLWLAMRPRLACEWYRRWGTWPVAAWMRAADHFVQGDFAVAAALYEQGLRRHPKHPASACARMDLGYCYYRTAEYSRAISELRGLIDSKTGLRDSYLLLSRIHQFMGSSAEALSVLEEAVAEFAWDINVLSTLLHTALWNRSATRSIATAYQRLSELRSELLLDDARRVMVDSAFAHYELCLGNESNGERLLVRALATGVAPFEAVLLRAERLLAQHRIYPAREQLSRAMQLSPRNPHPVRLLAESYLIPGDFLIPDYAVQLATHACQLSKWNNRSTIELLARAQRQVGEVAIAELYEEQAKRLPPVVHSEAPTPELQRDLRLRALKVNA